MPGVFKRVRRRYRDPPVPANGKHKRLVIVESPAKARTIKGYLGDDFVVESSVGHIRDLPERAADIPEEYKKEKWARLGVDVADGFRPLYIVDPDKKKRVAELKKLLKNADELLLATDEDREGEAIAWHLLEVLKPTVPVRRMVFHEITKDAINRALGETRDIDERLVDAQETRRILDRLYGYEVSPVLWKKITRGLSAGRVQSVATRLVVERERERMAFRAASWWDIEATFDPDSFQARLVSVDGKRVAQGRDRANDVPDRRRLYERKVKNAQEAHEGIRPSGDSFRTPQDVKGELNRDEGALYELIWMRTIASQMKDAAGQTVSLRIAGTSSAGEQAEFGASGTVITFRGFLAAYEESRDTDERVAESEDDERRLPNV